MNSETNNNEGAINTDHFDMCLRSTKSDRKKMQKQHEHGKSQVMTKLKELLVLKAESGEKIYELTERSAASPTSNLHSIGENISEEDL